MVTISDKKIGVSSNGTTIDYYNADVITANDYYPGGSQMPGRNYSQPNTKYRYGFNGKEKSSEITSDDYDFGARIYDGRIGRWLSTDIVTKPFISPYNFAANNPVNYLDPNGEDNIHFYYVIVRQYADGKLITSKPTKFYTVEKTNTANVFVHHKYELRYDGVGSDGKATSSKVPIDTRFYPDVPGSTSGLTSSYGITDNDRKTLIKFIDEFSVCKQSVDIDYTELNSPGSNASKRLQNAQWWDGVFKEKAFWESQEQEQNNRASFVLGVVSIFGGEALLVEKILGKVTSAIISIDSKAFPKLVEHGFRAGRNADIGLSTEIASVKTYNTLMSNASRLKVGDNELLIKINGIQKTITANISEEGVLRNINMIPGVSNRTKVANKIDLGKTTW